MVEKSKLDEDKEGKSIDSSHYRGMIGTLLYLTASRPDLQFSICMCDRFRRCGSRWLPRYSPEYIWKCAVSGRETYQLVVEKAKERCYFQYGS
uniref:Uncharacterized mitochondrial protein AtMg00810-like n=1 Tax=Tanacetum cinerariifolium TaxID=118510 RepID=A0A699RGS8_TANCI|nr:uncharacterized mitochondrial protein AtMg00810-like [Tanacetum cinerariifolium]